MRWSRLLNMDQAKRKGDDTYIDLTDIFYNQELTNSIALELKYRLKLQYIPIIRQI